MQPTLNSDPLLCMRFWPSRKEPDRFDQALRDHVDGELSLFACGKDAPAESEIKAFEDTIGFRLPDDFRNLSKSSLGGIYIEAKESVWPRPQQYAVGPFWSFLYGFYVYGFAKGIRDWMNIRIGTEQFRSESGTDFVPCLRVISDADVFCFDSNGDLRQWNHEMGEAQIQGCTFTELFARQVRELRQRKDRKVAGEDKSGFPPAPVP